MTEANTIHIVPKTSPQGEIDLLALLKKYLLSKWYWYLIGASIGLYLAHTQLQTVAPVYEIKSRILIKENKGVASTAEDILVEKLYLGSSKSLDNEIEVLKSHSMMEDVVKTLHLNITYIWPGYLEGRHRYGKFPIYIDTLAVANEDLYTKPFFLEPIDSQHFAFKTDTLIGTYALNEVFNNEYGTFRVSAKAPMPLDKKKDLQVNFQSTAAVADKYLKKIKIGSGDHASMVDLKIEDEAPPRGIAILNTLVDRYNFTTVQDKSRLAKTTLQFVDERLKAIVKDLKAVERNIENYKKQNNIITEAGANASILTNEVKGLTKEENELTIKLSIFESMLQSIDVTSDTFQLLPTNLSNVNANLMSLLDQYNKLVLKRQQLLESAQPSNPLIISITQDIKILRLSVVATLTNYANDIRLKINTLNSRSTQLTAQLKSIPTKERGLLESKRQQNLKENLYIYLLKKREEIALALTANGPNCRIIDRSRSSASPVSPNPPIFYIGGIMTGLFLPFLFIVGRDVFKSTIDSVAEIKSIVPTTPIIGVIHKNQSVASPYSPILKKGGFAIPTSLSTRILNWKHRFFKDTSKSAVVVRNQQSDAITEDFFMVRSNLPSLASDITSVFLLTAAQQRVGTTFVAINLAMSFALTNKKTLLLDLNLRSPSVAADMQLPNHKVGISDYLADTHDLPSIIQSSKETNNLHILTAGTLPKSIPSFLTHPRLAQLFSILKNQYEIILIDSPPVGLIADAFFLNEFATHTIYVVRQDQSKTSDLKQAITLFEQEKLVNPSIIFNDAT